jgi:hypothetical protein
VVQTLSLTVDSTAMTTELQDMGKRTFDTWIYRKYLVSIIKKYFIIVKLDDNHTGLNIVH